MKSSPKPKRGRPPLPKAKRATSQIQLRVTTARKDAYQTAAKGQPLTRWAFAALDAAAGYREP